MKRYKHHDLTPELIKAGIEINGLDETLSRLCDLMEDVAENAISTYKIHLLQNEVLK